MNRRNFLALLGCVPGLGFVAPKTKCDGRRVGIVKVSSQLWADQRDSLIRMYRPAVVTDWRYSFSHNAVELRLEGPMFDVVPEAAWIPHYRVIETAGGCRFEKTGIEQREI